MQWGAGQLHVLSAAARPVNHLSTQHTARSTPTHIQAVHFHAPLVVDVDMLALRRRKELLVVQKLDGMRGLLDLQRAVGAGERSLRSC